MALATGKPSFVIKYGSKDFDMGYFYRINHAFGTMAQFATWVSDAKTFASEKSAQKFIDKWSGAGVGLSADLCKIIPKTF